ncbi:hypothetical protein [Mucilaginibacter sp.]|uniref:ThiF family adenylyltransferase n=1 Tax=Mucilaginibacter sp. TaxID=1882438 RepID=UPI00262BEB9B|nr:hypothetical protein [Mucilaginibacter sp.]MDB4921213.1 hypothetical protein [Mucilaginibacter sp.]
MKEDWYKERNKRTDGFADVKSVCHEVHATIKVTADAGHYDTQVMLKVLLNILARWCNNIHVCCPEVRDISEVNSTLPVSMRGLLSKIDPFGNFTFGDEAQQGDITVFIGPPESDYLQPFIAIDSGGWISSCSFNNYGHCEKVTNDSNPLGPAMAACLANAELFRWANSIISVPYSKWYSLYDLSVSTNSLICPVEFSNTDLGRLHVVGCGAIGSSFTYLINLTDLYGTLTFVDADQGVELHNTSSSLLFTPANVGSGLTKASLCAGYINRNFLVSEIFDGDYKNFGYKHDTPAKSAEVILCFANDFDIWSTVQHLYPPTVFHATTSRSWGINVGRHIPLKDNCIMCTFQQLARTKYVPVCAEGAMPQKPVEDNAADAQEPHASILPFLSPAAAVVALAELVKYKLGKRPDENTVQFNMSTSDGVLLDDQERAFNCAICQHQSAGIYKNLYVEAV